MKTSSFALSLAFLFAGLLAGCGGSESETPTSSFSTASDTSTEDDSAISRRRDKPETEATTDGDTASTESDTGLTIGSPAPELQVAGFLKGEEVTELTRGQVYVIEFWATWCRPCIMNMPHLAELQTKYGDEVTFIGITDEDAEAVESFLARTQSEGTTWDDVISYRLAQDTESEHMYTNYFRAAGQEGIPWACIVGRDGIVEWHGYPAMIDEPLQQIVAGSWDRGAAIAQLQQQEKIREVEVLANSGKMEEAITLLREILKDNPDDVQGQVFLATLLQASGKAEEALALLKAVAASNPEIVEVNGMIADALLAQGQTEAAYELFRKMVTAAWDDPRMLDGIAWGIATEHKEPDLELAKKAALRAVELTESKDPSSLETTARVFFESGDVAGAIEWQKKAIAAHPTEPGLKKTLAEFEAAAKEGDTP